MKKVLEVVTDQFEEIEAVGTLAILRRANLDVTFAAIKSENVKGRYNVEISNMIKLNSIKSFDQFSALIIPGGPEYIEEERNPKFLDLINYFAKEKKLLAAICAGPTILGHLGLLKDKKYTCFTSMNEDFKGTYIDKPVVIDDNLITARSAAATIDFAFAIIEYLHGQKYSQMVKESIYY